MTALNFWALQYLQLAETGAIQFSVPLLIAMLSSWLLRERLDARRWAAIAVGFAGVLLVILLMGLLGFAISRSIVNPLAEIKRAMQQVAAGDLVVSIPIHGKDELGVVATCTNQGLDAIRHALLEASQGARNVADAALRIAASAEQTNQAVNSQRDQLAQLATAMNEMSATISDVAGHAEAPTAGELKQAAMNAPRLARQFLADAARRPIVTVTCEEPVLLGSAILGAVAAGAFDDVATAMRAMSHVCEITQPSSTWKEVHEQRFTMFGRLQALSRVGRDS